MYTVEVLYIESEEKYAYLVYSDQGNLMFYSYELFDTRKEAIQAGENSLI